MDNIYSTIHDKGLYKEIYLNKNNSVMYSLQEQAYSYSFNKIKKVRKFFNKQYWQYNGYCKICKATGCVLQTIKKLEVVLQNALGNKTIKILEISDIDFRYCRVITKSGQNIINIVIKVDEY